MTATDHGRWPRLQALFGAWRSKNHDEYFNMGRLAIHLREALAVACGCPDDYVTHYKYSLGPVPIADTTERVENGWDSLVQSEGSWVFGLGIKLESAVNEYPKTILTLPVNAQHRSDMINVSSTLFSGTEIVRFGNEYKNDLDAVAEKMYGGLSDALERWSGDERAASKFGFAARGV